MIGGRRWILKCWICTKSEIEHFVKKLGTFFETLGGFLDFLGEVCYYTIGRMGDYHNRKNVATHLRPSGQVLHTYIFYQERKKQL